MQNWASKGGKGPAYNCLFTDKKRSLKLRPKGSENASQLWEQTLMQQPEGSGCKPCLALSAVANHFPSEKLSFHQHLERMSLTEENTQHRTGAHSVETYSLHPLLPWSRFFAKILPLVP